MTLVFAGRILVYFDNGGGLNSSGRVTSFIHYLFPEADTIVYDSHTLDDIDKWCLVPARCLCNVVERDIKTMMHSAVFGSNGEPSWDLVRMGNEAYLDDLWQQGVLLGCTQHEAYFVQVGEDPTKKENKINQGKDNNQNWAGCGAPGRTHRFTTQ
ncbi:hypothetical protein DFQ30_002205 [Apophysomyces sp. BC1015]|nr:hypothetical protein DFQ30_002205 [Apophysomyces sp. BC1015]